MTLHIHCDYPRCSTDLAGEPMYVVEFRQPEEYTGDDGVDEVEELVYCEDHIALFEPLLPAHLEYKPPEEVTA